MPNHAMPHRNRNLTNPHASSFFCYSIKTHLSPASSTKNLILSKLTILSLALFLVAAHQADASISYLSPYMRTKPYIASVAFGDELFGRVVGGEGGLKEVRDGRFGSTGRIHRSTKAERMAEPPMEMTGRNLEGNGFVYQEKFFEPELFMNQLRNDDNKAFASDSAVAATTLLHGQMRKAQRSSAENEDNAQVELRTTSTTAAPMPAVTQSSPTHRYNRNCFFSPMNCRMWREPVVEDGSELRMHHLNQGGEEVERPRAIMVRSARASNFQLRPQPSMWRIFGGL